MAVTRRSERRALEGVRVRLSPWLLAERCRCGWGPVGFHKPDLSGSKPEPAIESAKAFAFALEERGRGSIRELTPVPFRLRGFDSHRTP